MGVRFGRAEFRAEECHAELRHAGEGECQHVPLGAGAGGPFPGLDPGADEDMSPGCRADDQRLGMRNEPVAAVRAPPGPEVKADVTGDIGAAHEIVACADDAAGGIDEQNGAAGVAIHGGADLKRPAPRVCVRTAGHIDLDEIMTRGEIVQAAPQGCRLMRAIGRAAATHDEFGHTRTGLLLLTVKQSFTLRCLVGSMPLPYPEHMKKDTSVNVRLTSELKAELQQLADRDSRKLSAYIELVLCAHVAAKRAAAPGESGVRKNAKAR